MISQKQAVPVQPFLNLLLEREGRSNDEEKKLIRELELNFDRVRGSENKGGGFLHFLES